MRRFWPALAVLFCGIASGGAPSYSAAGIVMAASYAPGPFPPYGLVSIYGSDLATGRHELAPSDIAGDRLPNEMLSTRVYVNGQPVPLLFVSDTQINFLLPGALAVKPQTLWVSREGWAGPEIKIPMGNAAPALFPLTEEYAIATHADPPRFTPISAEKPAAPGELIVLYAEGLGKTDSIPSGGEIPHYASQLLWLDSLRVMVGGVAVDPSRILYAGLSPDSVGLYQINFYLPEDAGPDPEIRVFVGDAGSQAGLKLPLR